MSGVVGERRNCGGLSASQSDVRLFNFVLHCQYRHRESCRLRCLAYVENWDEKRDDAIKTIM